MDDDDDDDYAVWRNKINGKQLDDKEVLRVGFFTANKPMLTTGVWLSPADGPALLTLSV